MSSQTTISVEDLIKIKEGLVGLEFLVPHLALGDERALNASYTWLYLQKGAEPNRCSDCLNVINRVDWAWLLG